jgi:hypothetical protein
MQGCALKVVSWNMHNQDDGWPLLLDLILPHSDPQPRTRRTVLGVAGCHGGGGWGTGGRSLCSDRDPVI